MAQMQNEQYERALKAWVSSDDSSFLHYMLSLWRDDWREAAKQRELGVPQVQILESAFLRWHKATFSELSWHVPAAEAAAAPEQELVGVPYALQVWSAQCVATLKHYLFLELFSGWALVAEGMRLGREEDGLWAGEEIFRTEGTWPKFLTMWSGPRSMQRILEWHD